MALASLRVSSCGQLALIGLIFLSVGTAIGGRSFLSQSYYTRGNPFTYPRFTPAMSHYFARSNGVSLGSRDITVKTNNAKPCWQRLRPVLEGEPFLGEPFISPNTYSGKPSFFGSMLHIIRYGENADQLGTIDYITFKMGPLITWPPSRQFTEDDIDSADILYRPPGTLDWVNVREIGQEWIFPSNVLLLAPLVGDDLRSTARVICDPNYSYTEPFGITGLGWCRSRERKDGSFELSGSNRLRWAVNPTEPNIPNVAPQPIPRCPEAPPEPKPEAMNCPSMSDFRCKNENCIPSGWVCDGENDCGDWSDQQGCSRNCQAFQFGCDNGKCILVQRRCDGVNDCGDMSDEQGCLSPCRSDHFTCLNKNCVRASFQCDGKNDCGDWSDEKNYLCLQK